MQFSLYSDTCIRQGWVVIVFFVFFFGGGSILKQDSSCKSDLTF